MPQIDFLKKSVCLQQPLTFWDCGDLGGPWHPQKAKFRQLFAGSEKGSKGTPKKSLFSNFLVGPFFGDRESVSEKQKKEDPFLQAFVVFGVFLKRWGLGKGKGRGIDS